MEARRRSLVALGLALAAACATEAPRDLSRAIEDERLRAERGVGTLERALASPGDLALGEGVRDVERATRALADLEDDPRATVSERLRAALVAAHAWDQALASFDRAARRDPVLDRALAEKAFPFRLAAIHGYQRTLRRACDAGRPTDEAALAATEALGRLGVTAWACVR